MSNTSRLKKDKKGSCFIMKGMLTIAYMVLIQLLQSFRSTLKKKKELLAKCKNLMNYQKKCDT